MLRKRLNHADGSPVWSCQPGTELIDGFLAWERLAVGPRCETWLVWSGWMWCPAVLRLTRPHHVEHPRGRNPLAREVAALHGNQHPALPRLYHDGVAARVPYLALEHVDGPSLGEELAGAPLDEPEVALLGARLLTGLLALHRKGIAHLDLKPETVVLRDMRPVLTEFGSARGLGTRQTGRVIGTPGYAAPELAGGAPIADTMDLYSLGAVLHEALGGGPLGHSPLTRLVSGLLNPDPARRPSAGEALTAFASVLPADLRPWPTWADACA